MREASVRTCSEFNQIQNVSFPSESVWSAFLKGARSEREPLFWAGVDPQLGPLQPAPAAPETTSTVSTTWPRVQMQGQMQSLVCRCHFLQCVDHMSPFISSFLM